jgi:hypothetical protein
MLRTMRGWFAAGGWKRMAEGAGNFDAEKNCDILKKLSKA